jgi:hypothetical protein
MNHVNIDARSIQELFFHMPLPAIAAPRPIRAFFAPQFEAKYAAVFFIF